MSKTNYPGGMIGKMPKFNKRNTEFVAASNAKTIKIPVASSRDKEIYNDPARGLAGSTIIDSKLEEYPDGIMRWTLYVRKP